MHFFIYRIWTWKLNSTLHCSTLYSLDVALSANQITELTIKNCFAKVKFVEEKIQKMLNRSKSGKLCLYKKRWTKMRRLNFLTFSRLTSDLWLVVLLLFEEAQSAWNTVCRFMQQSSWKNDIMKACNRLTNKMLEIRLKKMHQLAIFNSFYKPSILCHPLYYATFARSQ